MRSSLPFSPASTSPKGYSTPLCDVVCEHAAVLTLLAGAASHGVLWQAAPGRFLLDVPGIARYLVEEGHRITIDAPPLTSPAEIERFLRMTPLAALCWQRGRLALHAAAVLGPNGAILIAGDSGCGKSALLAGLLMRGWTMLADDIALPVIDAQGQWAVLPTHPEIMLWPDTLKQLSLHASQTDPQELDISDLLSSGLRSPVLPSSVLPSSDVKSTDRNAALISTHASGRRLALRTEQFASVPGLLRGIYWLSHHADHAADRIQVAEVKGAERFKAIGSLAYNTHIADALLNREAYFCQALSLANHVPMWRLWRPRGRWTVEELVAHIVQEAA